ncbi:MAG: xylulokinase [Candidatus Brockarchaeota archaeon]|nr:xylulokinase [Candidatus Brockarchaeota archaeon]
MGYLLGIDVATTGAKVLAIDENGRVASSSFRPYPLQTPRPNWAEQDPEEWWNAVTGCLREVVGKKVRAEEIEAIGLTGQMHGAVVLGRNDEVLRPCILWCDQRTASQCDEIMRKFGRKRFIDLTNNVALPGFTAPKILWIRENEPGIYSKIKKVLLPKDYVRFRLTGEFATEVSDASGTVLFDVKRRRWSDEVLEELQIPREMMPDCFESPFLSGEVSGEAASATGLRKGTPVAGGGGDQAAGAVGNGIVRSGLVSCTIGTSGVVFASCDEPLVDPEARLHSFCHAVPGKWHVMGVMLSAGGSFRWFRDALGGEEVGLGKERGVDPYVILADELAPQAEPGCEGLIFLPYLMGERTPYPNPNAKGVFFGITLRHKKAHLARSVMEGVAYGMRDSLELVKNLGIEIEQVRASGGGGRSPLWRQIQADIYNAEIVTVSVDEGPAFGAALIAGAGAGIFRSVEDACGKAVALATRTKPVQENAKLYEKYYEVYKELYSSLVEEFDKVSRIVLEELESKKVP